MERELSVKQQRLVNEYLANGGNGVKAAQAAGYAGTYDTLRSVASETLAKPHVQMHLRARLEAEAVTPDRIIAETAIVAFLPIDHEIFKRKEYDKFGGLKAESVDINPKLTALRDLGKYAGMGRETVDINITNQPVRQLLYLAPDHPLRAQLVSGERDADVETDPEIQPDRDE